MTREKKRAKTKPNSLRRSFARNELRSACHVPVVANEPNSRVTRGLSNDRLRWSISGDPSGPPNGSGWRGARLDLARRIAPLRRVVETRPHPEVRGRSPAGGRKKDATIEAKSDQHKTLPQKDLHPTIKANWLRERTQFRVPDGIGVRRGRERWRGTGSIRPRVGRRATGLGTRRGVRAARAGSPGGPAKGGRFPAGKDPGAGSGGRFGWKGGRGKKGPSEANLEMIKQVMAQRFSDMPAARGGRERSQFAGGCGSDQGGECDGSMGLHLQGVQDSAGGGAAGA